jgi:hypothetical protein
MPIMPKISDNNADKTMSDKRSAIYNPNSEFLLYKTPNGDIKVDVLIQNKTIWMPQKKNCGTVRC